MQGEILTDRSSSGFGPTGPDQAVRVGPARVDTAIHDASSQISRSPHLSMDDGRQGRRGEQLSDRIGAGAGQKEQVAVQGRPARFPGQSVEQQVATLVQAGNQRRVGDVFGSEVERVLAGGGAEPDGGILHVPPQGGGRLRGGVAGQHLLAQLGSCPRTTRIGPDWCVRVSVLDQ